MSRANYHQIYFFLHHKGSLGHDYVMVVLCDDVAFASCTERSVLYSFLDEALNEAGQL